MGVYLCGYLSMAFVRLRVQLLILCTFVNVRDEIDSDLDAAQ